MELISDIMGKTPAKFVKKIGILQIQIKDMNKKTYTAVCILLLQNLIIANGSYREIESYINKLEHEADSLIQAGKYAESKQKDSEAIGIMEFLGDANSLNKVQVNGNLILKDELNFEDRIYFLKSIAARSQSKLPSTLSGKAQISLAKLGDSESYFAILNDLESDDPAKQSHAIVKLGLVGTNGAIFQLAKLLHDDSLGVKHGGVIYMPIAVQASNALSKAVKNPPVKKSFTHDDVLLWKRWWKLNKHLYGQDEKTFSNFAHKNTALNDPSSNETRLKHFSFGDFKISALKNLALIAAAISIATAAYFLILKRKK